ncbi:hypothetical protein [Frankia sp. Cas4]|uniref:hypothetical protein n=1 Tax=Frankia sp. Cas4 TaxID=3073927 RepID=UPI002AD38685|nr:hypothetical protein [Frankia sp. Cas4]
MTKINYTKVLDQLALQVGGLIEIYVLGASYEDWSRVIDGLRQAGYEMALTELETEIPVDFGPHVFDKMSDVEYRLAIRLGCQVWTSSFYSLDSIDFQGDPRDVTSTGDLVSIIQLMMHLNESLAKRVVLVPETFDPGMVEPYLAIP